MAGNRRLTPQQTQENVSRKSLAMFLEQHRWITSDVTPDLGEDFLVRIYNESGRFSGISIYIQLKSVYDGGRFKIKNGDISYPFETKDLEHWGQSAQPILLVIWDVKREQGHYLLVADAISLLNSRNKTWRHRKYVKVHFPREHVLNEEALRRLRFDLATTLTPLVSKGKDFEIQYTITKPAQGEGYEKFVEHQRFIDAGDSVEIPRNFFTELKFPEWWTDLYGPQEIEALWMGPADYTDVYSFQIRLFAAGMDPVIISPIEFRMEKAGKKEATLSNYQQTTYNKIKLVTNWETQQFQFSWRFDAEDIDGYEARDILRIRQALSEGCKIVIRRLDVRAELDTNIHPNPEFAPSPEIIDAVNKICRIQDLTGDLFVFQEGDSHRSEDPHTLDRLIAAFEKGEYIYLSDFEVELRKAAIQFIMDRGGHTRPLKVGYSLDDMSQILLGKEISLGPVTIEVRGIWDVNGSDVLRWLESANEEDTYLVVLRGAEVTEIYKNRIEA